MLTLTWVEQQIEDALNGSNTPQNVRDYALLCIARDNIKANLERVRANPNGENSDAVNLVSYSADLDTVPTIEQIGKALTSISCHSEQEKQRAKDLKTWADILSTGR